MRLDVGVRLMMEHPIPDAALDQPMAFVGATGSGKTYAAKGAVESLLTLGRRVCIIDPTGVWFGLRTGADGRSAGFPVVIFGGEHADVPIQSGAGARLGDIIAGNDVPASIVDVSEFSGGEATAFLTPFFESLYARNRGALHLVLDEADAMAPQNPMPETRRLVGAVDKIARRGRVKGFRLMSITQRPAVLHKNVLSQVATLVAMQLRSPQDRKAIEAWIQGNADADRAREVLASLPKLGRGEGFVWFPGGDLLERVAFPPITTFDSSRTPEHGDEVVEPRALATVDVEALRAALVSHEEAQPEKQGRSSRADEEQAAAATAAAEQRGYERGYTEGVENGRTQAIMFIDSAVTALVSTVERFRAGDAPHPISHAEATALLAAPATSPAQPLKRPVASSSKTEASVPGHLNSAARKMLAVLDTNPPVRRSWTQIATLAGLKARGGHFNAGKKALIDQAWVEEAAGLVSIRQTSATSRPPTADPAALVDLWAANLSGAAPKILRHLFVAGRQTREQVGEALGLQPRGGHWNAAWKELRDNGIVEEAGGVVCLTDLFRPAMKP